MEGYGEMEGGKEGREKKKKKGKGEIFATLDSVEKANEKQSAGRLTGIQSSANREQSYFDRYQRNRSALSAVARVYSRILLLDGGARSARLYFAG